MYTLIADLSDQDLSVTSLELRAELKVAKFLINDLSTKLQAVAEDKSQLKWQLDHERTSHQIEVTSLRLELKRLRGSSPLPQKKTFSSGALT